MRAWPTALLALLVLLSVASATAEYAWIQFDDPPAEDAGDVGVDEEEGDMVDLFYSPTYTNISLRMDLAALPDPDNYTYIVYLDNLADSNWFNFRLVYDDQGARLESRSGFTWGHVKDLNVTIDPVFSSLIFDVLIADIAGIANMRVAFRTYDGTPWFWNIVDRAPDSGAYLIEEETIPNLPALVLPAFVGAIAATVLVLRKRILPF